MAGRRHTAGHALAPHDTRRLRHEQRQLLAQVLRIERLAFPTRVEDAEGGAQLHFRGRGEPERWEQRRHVLSRVPLALHHAHERARHAQLVPTHLAGLRHAYGRARQPDVVTVRAQRREAAASLGIVGAHGTHHLAESLVLELVGAVGAQPVDECLPLVRLEVARQQGAQVARELSQIEDAAVLAVPDVKGALHLLLGLVRTQELRAEEGAHNLTHLFICKARVVQGAGDLAGALEPCRRHMGNVAQFERRHCRQAVLQRAQHRVEQPHVRPMSPTPSVRKLR